MHMCFMYGHVPVYRLAHLPGDIYVGARNPHSSLHICMTNAYPPGHLPSHLKHQVFKSSIMKYLQQK